MFIAKSYYKCFSINLFSAPVRWKRKLIAGSCIAAVILLVFAFVLLNVYFGHAVVLRKSGTYETGGGEFPYFPSAVNGTKTPVATDMTSLLEINFTVSYSTNQYYLNLNWSSTNNTQVAVSPSLTGSYTDFALSNGQPLGHINLSATAYNYSTGRHIHVEAIWDNVPVGASSAFSGVNVWHVLFEEQPQQNYTLTSSGLDNGGYPSIPPPEQITFASNLTLTP